MQHSTQPLVDYPHIAYIPVCKRIIPNQPQPYPTNKPWFVDLYCPHDNAVNRDEAQLIYPTRYINGADKHDPWAMKLKALAWTLGRGYPQPGSYEVYIYSDNRWNVKHSRSQAHGTVSVFSGNAQELRAFLLSKGVPVDGLFLS